MAKIAMIIDNSKCFKIFCKNHLKFGKLTKKRYLCGMNFK